MDHPLIDLINARVEQAEADGAFDDLPGVGKPLAKCDDPENALLNRIFRENGAVPEFVSLSRELVKLRGVMRETGDQTERRRIMQDMSMMEARIGIVRKNDSR